MINMGNATPVPDASKKRYTEQATPFPELNYSNAGYSLQLAPMLFNIDGKDAYVVTVTSPSGTVSKKYYDAQTGLKLRDEVTTEQGTSSYDYSNYKEVSGIMLPYTQIVSQGVDFTLTVTEAKINSGLKDEDFQ
jgi:hypothetical protein